MAWASWTAFVGPLRTPSSDPPVAGPLSSTRSPAVVEVLKLLVVLAVVLAV